MKKNKFTSVSLKYKKNNIEGKIFPPSYFGDAGYDVCSIVDATISPGERCELDTGLSFEVPYGYYLTAETRSSYGILRGLRVHRSIIDAGFRNKYTVIMYNHGKEIQNIKKGDKIAQMVLHRSIVMQLEEVKELSESERGKKQWGSSDKKLA